MLSYTTYNWPHPNFSSNHPQPKLPSHPPSSGKSNFIDAAMQSLYQHCCFIFALTLFVGLSKNILLLSKDLKFCKSLHLFFISCWIDYIIIRANFRNKNKLKQILFQFLEHIATLHNCMLIQNKQFLKIC